MNRTRLGALMIVVGFSSCMWACGDDDDDTGPTGGSGGKAGSSNGGTAGKAGSSNGGTAGKAGGSNGGTAGKAGSSNGGSDGGGEGGTDNAGAGGTAPGGGGAGGEPNAGAGGTDAGNGGGGEGGAPEVQLTLVEACATVCDTFFTGHPATCGTGTEEADESDCNTNCSNYDFGDDVATEGLFLTYTRCAATKLTSSDDYACGSDFNSITATPMFPVASGECDTELCTWVCADAQSNTAPEVYDRCNCPTP